MLQYLISADVRPKGKSGYFFPLPQKVEQHSICYPKLPCVFLTLITHTHQSKSTITKLVKPSSRDHNRLRRPREPILNEGKEFPRVWEKWLQINTSMHTQYNNTHTPNLFTKGRSINNFSNHVIMLWYSDRLMTCELGYVYFLSDILVWTANPGASYNPNLFLKSLRILPPRLNIGQSDRRPTGKRKHMCVCMRVTQASVRVCVHAWAYYVHSASFSYSLWSGTDTTGHQISLTKQ